MDRNLNLNVNSDKIRSGLKQVDSSLKRTERNGVQTARMIKNSTDSASKSMNLFARAISGAAAAYGAISFAKTIGEFQQLEHSLGVVFQDVDRGKAVFQELQQIALETPFSVQQLTESVIKLRAAGIEPTQAQLALFSDVASVTTDKVGALQSITDLFSRTTAGGLGLEELNRLADRGIPVYDILAQRLGVTRLEVSELGKSAEGAQQILGALTQGLEERFGGAAADAAGLLSNQISNLGIAWDGFQQSLGEAGGLSLATSLVEGLTNSINFLSDNLSYVESAMVGIATAALPAMIKGIKTLTLAMRANPLGLLITGIGFAAAAIYEFRDTIWEFLVKTFEVTLPNAVDKAQIAFMKMKRGVGETMNGILGSINDFGNSLVASAPDWLKAFFGIGNEPFKLGIDIDAVNAQIDELEATITNRLNNFQKPDPIEGFFSEGSTSEADGLSGDSSLTGVSTGGVNLPAVDDQQLQDRLATQIETIQESLLSEEQRIAESYERRAFMVEDAFQQGLITDQYRRELQLGLEQEFEDQKTAIAERGAEERKKVLMGTLSSTASALGSLSQLLSSAGKKQSSAHKVFAKASILTSTAVAIMRAWELPWPANLAAAAAAAAAGATQLAAVGKAGTIANNSATNPVSSNPSLAATPIATPQITDASTRGETVIALQGNFYGWNDEVIDELVEGIAAAVDDRDVRIISPDSRNGQDLVAEAG